MKKLIFVLFLLQAGNSFSQELIYKYSDIQIIKADTFYPGLYLTYEEFIKNSPSKTDIYFKNNTDFDWGAALFSKHWEDLYYYDSTDTKIKLKDKIWGYSNDQKVFVYHKKRYCPIKILGRYTVFIWRVDQSYWNNQSVSFSSNEKEFVLDILTGEIYPLTKKTFKKHLLKNYPEILERFKNESMVHTMFYMYIKEVNSKFEY
ncbi:MAG TPA: hypothetical protein DCG75_17960 [Bacteroidales bacterium]|nr:hypothetical protein [Bacteroidales bacterium]